jgi:hypothetical protein
VATALVAALVGLVGVLIASVAGIDPAEPSWLVGDAVGGGAGARYALTGFVAALGGTVLLHVMLLVVPHPLRFFHWIVGLATVAAATLAFAASGDLSEQIVASAIAAAMGIAIGSLLSGVAAWSVRVTAPREGRGPQPGLA